MAVKINQTSSVTQHLHQKLHKTNSP